MQHSRVIVLTDGSNSRQSLHVLVLFVWIDVMQRIGIPWITCKWENYINIIPYLHLFTRLTLIITKEGRKSSITFLSLGFSKNKQTNKQINKAYFGIVVELKCELSTPQLLTIWSGEINRNCKVNLCPVWIKDNMFVQWIFCFAKCIIRKLAYKLLQAILDCSWLLTQLLLHNIGILESFFFGNNRDSL